MRSIRVDLNTKAASEISCSRLGETPWEEDRTLRRLRIAATLLAICRSLSSWAPAGMPALRAAPRNVEMDAVLGIGGMFTK